MERQFIQWLGENLPPSGSLRVGLGDDAAVLKWLPPAEVVVTADAVTDEVDFRVGHDEPELIGRKALGVNLSDLAAMAAEPIAVVTSLVLPRKGAFDLAVRIVSGMRPLAEQFGVALAGGDTNLWDGPLVVAVTAIGRTTAKGPLTRGGARPGDVLLATGAFGGSILGRHLAVEPRVAEALQLHAAYELHAGIDVSDGLSLDALRLAEASGCGVVLDVAAIPITAAAHRLAASSGRSAIEHALGDGEDFELLLAAPPEAAQAILRDRPTAVPIAQIGVFIEVAGLWQAAPDGRREPLEPAGFLHQ